MTDVILDETIGPGNTKKHAFHVAHNVCHKKGRHLFLRYMELYKRVGADRPGHAPDHIQIQGKNCAVWFTLLNEFTPSYPGHWRYVFDNELNMKTNCPKEAQEYVVYLQDDSVMRREFP
jgi:hypothetical protein